MLYSELGRREIEIERDRIKNLTLEQLKAEINIELEKQKKIKEEAEEKLHEELRYESQNDDEPGNLKSKEHIRLGNELDSINQEIFNL